MALETDERAAEIYDLKRRIDALTGDAARIALKCILGDTPMEKALEIAEEWVLLQRALEEMERR